MVWEEDGSREGEDEVKIWDEERELHTTAPTN